MFNKYSSRHIILSLPLILITAAVILIWLIYAPLKNTLNRNGRWLSSKIALGKYVCGSEDFFCGRPALAFNHLNLGAWHGFQELITKSDFPLSSIDVDFYLSNHSYFYFIFNKTQDEFSAVRLSNHSLFPSAFLKIKDSGEYISTQAFTTPDLLANRWHHLKLIFDATNNKLGINIDHQETIAINTSITTSKQHIGFRGSYQTVLIDNILAANQYNQIVFSDNFNYHDPQAVIKFVFVFLLLTFVAASIYFSIKRIKMNSAIALYSTIIFLFNLLLFLVMAKIYIHFFYINAYPNPNSPLNRLLVSLQIQPSTVENKLYVHVKQNKIDRYKNDSSFKILFLGSSQTWGAGAKRADEIYVKVAESIANQQQPKIKYTFINEAINGVTSGDLLKYYKK